mmetsp:Transcript_39010/g.48310  ORF Transcript_39010/g.48310 Transcript_39010/m.48310 type:complete len:304 (+) Transcript_39010:2-913(+)
MKRHIAVKLDSDETTSLLSAFRKVLRGACDGALVLDSRNCDIVGDASSLELLLKSDKKLAETNFLDFFLDTESRQRFQEFLQSETASESAIPRCLRISLQGAEGPVSIDAFCSSCTAAGQTCHLVALKADPDQFLAPPDAESPKAPWERDIPEWNDLHDPLPPKSEVAEAFRELVQVSLLVNNETPSMDIEEVTLSFLRSGDDVAMPTLRNLIRLKDWDRVQGAFRHLSDGTVTSDCLSFAHPVLFRIPGSRRGNYLCAKEVTLNAEEEVSGAVRSFYVTLSIFDSRFIRKAKEQDLESICEE